MSECEQGRKRERRGGMGGAVSARLSQDTVAAQAARWAEGSIVPLAFLFFLLHSVLILLHWPREHSEEERKGGKIEELEEKERDKWITLSWRNRVQKSERDNSRHTFPCAASSCAYISCWVCIVHVCLARLEPCGSIWPGWSHGAGQQGDRERGHFSRGSCFPLQSSSALFWDLGCPDANSHQHKTHLHLANRYGCFI